MYVRYVGKKLPCIYSNPMIDFKAHFSNNTEIVPIAESDYDWIMKYNPTGFIERVDEKRLTPVAKAQLPPMEAIEPVVKKVVEKQKETPAFMCGKCGKEYKHLWHKRHYERHIAECEVVVDEPKVE